MIASQMLNVLQYGAGGVVELTIELFQWEIVYECLSQRDWEELCFLAGVGDEELSPLMRHEVLSLLKVTLLLLYPSLGRKW